MVTEVEFQLLFVGLFAAHQPVDGGIFALTEQHQLEALLVQDSDHMMEPVEVYRKDLHCGTVAMPNRKSASQGTVSPIRGPASSSSRLCSSTGSSRGLGGHGMDPPW
ncbi:hypothetical protein EYF80_041580 [Liparis tanakae]|uniref:Uncharacterized protein n=1 Tax=Liparis tanakae TaxID=230148 RepID=A0A4Z2G4P8_9TELE|nr:hypothetical protein EYF80_041580 [Liparis tanakae]